jgi:HK97 family phage portal protein
MTTRNSKKPGWLRATLLNWLGVPIKLTDSDFWSQYFGASSSSGVSVTDERMLRLSAVWACARLISETIATLPLSIYERTSAGKRVATQHPLQMIVHDMPNADSTSSVMWESVVAAMLLRGNARCEKLMVGERVVGLQFLDPRRLSISCDSQGKRVYRYTSKDGRQREIPAARVWTIPGFSLDGVEGVSVIRYGADVFGAAMSADSAAGSVFEKGLHPTTVWKFPTTLKDNQRAEAREAIKTISGAVNAGTPAVLEAGMDVTTIGINPNDAQLLESRAWSVEEICRWFRVPPFMVGHADKSTSWGSGIEQQMIGFLMFTLAPWLKRIEQAIWKDLLTPAERVRYYAKFSVEGLLRADSAGRAAFYSVMVNNGILTRDEVRELEDREPMGGNAAQLTVQSAMTLLDSIGGADLAEDVRASLRALLGFKTEDEKA